jgi:cyclopropane-fatty-acyl-phospholipid synthase
MALPAIRNKIKHLLAIADVKIGGSRPWDLQVHNDKFFTRVLTTGSLGLGESYLDGWWDCQQLDEFFYKILGADLGPRVKPWTEFFDTIRAKLYNLQKSSRAYHVAHHHYNIGNDLYEKMLDRRLIYSSAYWKTAKNLDEAQEAKLDLICRKLAIQPGMRILDIGCGWGGAIRYIAERYDAEILGVTVSQEQAQFASRLCKGMPVAFKVQDYRRLEEKPFDRIFSVGMFEHVGYKNYATFMRIVKKHLKNNGLFLLHTIGSNFSVINIDPWIHRYIFPNAMLPSAKQICRSIEKKFVMEDWHNFGQDYDKTLMAWYRNFTDNWHLLKNTYGDRFFRMWTYYLLSCAASFRVRRNQVWQIVLSPKGVTGGYIPCR